MITLEQLQDGIVIPIDKPRQWSSFQAVNKVKSIIRNTFGLKKFKIGHAGTLDPLATGLLLVCIGKATKRINELQDGIKVYTGTMILGATTPCFDLERGIDRYYPYQHIKSELIEEKRHLFIGSIEQVPPMFSAVKVDGQRAYEYARLDNPEVTIEPKRVTITDFQITNFREGSDNVVPSPTTTSAHPTGQALHLYNNPQGEVPAHLPQIDFRVQCSKGTYIRSLARDFGAALGSGAFLSALRREEIGEYKVTDALQLDEVSAFLQGVTA